MGKRIATKKKQKKPVSKSSKSSEDNEEKDDLICRPNKKRKSAPKKSMKSDSSSSSKVNLVSEEDDDDDGDEDGEHDEVDYELLLGRCFCITGTFSKSQPVMKALITDHGGVIKPGVSRNVHYVIAGLDSIAKSSSKVETAKNMEIPVLSEAFLHDTVSKGYIPMRLNKYRLDGQFEDEGDDGEDDEDDEDDEGEDDEGDDEEDDEDERDSNTKRKRAPKKATKSEARMKDDDDDEDGDEDEDEPNPNVFKGLSFCITGTFQQSQPKTKALITDHGGVIKPGVSKNVQYVIAGPDSIAGAASKVVAAKEKGIPVLSEEFLHDSISKGSLRGLNNYRLDDGFDDDEEDSDENDDEGEDEDEIPKKKQKRDPKKPKKPKSRNVKDDELIVCPIDDDFGGKLDTFESEQFQSSLFDVAISLWKPLNVHHFSGTKSPSQESLSVLSELADAVEGKEGQYGAGGGLIHSLFARAAGRLSEPPTASELCDLFRFHPHARCLPWVVTADPCHQQLFPRRHEEIEDEDLLENVHKILASARIVASSKDLPAAAISEHKFMKNGARLLFFSPKYDPHDGDCPEDCPRDESHMLSTFLPRIGTTKLTCSCHRGAALDKSLLEAFNLADSTIEDSRIVEANPGDVFESPVLAVAQLSDMEFVALIQFDYRD